MSGLIIAAFVLVVALLVTMARFGLRKFLGYSAVVDILFTVLMFALFAGTYSGIVASAFAGLFMTMMLCGLKYAVGYERLERKGFRVRWVHYPAKWSV